MGVISIPETEIIACELQLPLASKVVKATRSLCASHDSLMALAFWQRPGSNG